MDAALVERVDAFADGLHRIVFPDGRRALVKCRRGAPPGFFGMEAHGLYLLRATQTLRVPAVYALREHAIVIEDLGAADVRDGAWVRAGRGLARLHGVRSDEFGLDRDGWCGASPQPNTRMADGSRFFAECRLLFQTRRARDARLLGERDVDAIERLCADLSARVPVQPPALVHGDLWTGNLHVCGDGELALIDAGAVHYGWAETDLAMLTLFGAPPDEFFAGYQSVAGIDDSWRARAPVYNLYHLLNHLNLFGAGYLGAVRATLQSAA